MTLASDMRERITLERFVEGAGNIGHTYQPLDTVWAAAEPQGGGNYRFRIRHRGDLDERDHIEPAMHIVYRDKILILDDVIESVRGVEVTLLAHREIIEGIDHLPTGTRRIKSWP